jgi:NtrC-family two-component system sensor histidine kinase KinB
MGKVLGELFHDIRTPVGVLQGFCSNLLEGVSGTLTEEQKLSVERMSAAVELLVGLVENARERFPQKPDYEQPLPELRVNRRRQVDLRELTTELAEIFRPQAEQAAITLAIDTEPCPLVWGNRGRIANALMNLLSNALRFTPPEGEVEILLRGPGEQSRRHERACTITIRDTGSGIPEQDQEAIFESGYTSEPDQGHAGLGLATCKQVAKEHHGKIWVASVPGEGTSFYLELPIDPRARKRQLTIRSLAEVSRAVRLLMELHRHLDEPLPVTSECDPEKVAIEFADGGGNLLLVGEVDDRLRLAFEALTKSRR